MGFFGLLFSLDRLLLQSHRQLPVRFTSHSLFLVEFFRDGDFHLNPRESPAVYSWSIEDRNGIHPIKIYHWDLGYRGRPLSWYLDRGQVTLLGLRNYVLPTSDGKCSVSMFGAGPTLLAVPFVALFQEKGKSPELGDLLFVGRLAASFYTAAAASLLFLAACRFTDLKSALWVPFIYAFGTSAWSTTSATYLQHAPNSFFLALGIWFWSMDRKQAYLLSGLAFSFASAMRPTSGMFLLLAGVYLAFAPHRQRFVWFSMGAFAVLFIVPLCNVVQYGSPFAFGQAVAGKAIALQKTGTESLWQTPLWEGAAGLLFSPLAVY